MDISSLLAPGAVRVLGHLTSKKRLFQEIGEIMSIVHGLNPSIAVDGLQERESLGPTGVGHGIALPHARLQELDKIIGVFFRIEKPLDYDSVDRQPVDLVFALFAPKDSGVDHLKALALVSRTMRDAGVVTKLRANNDPAKLHAILTEARAPQAA
ncbi:PTS IIA-like nitrogen-regulatory protein PtsN [Pseudorhodobacter antarcticus]|jgi:PTS system nitrogen regulatory IIA component|uniref:PTS IIA-like nitrogen-regulatory protein PtsN n=1 Tax=Pseudorhodobacter antarcticus TaxID=1077947 RepID=A0A1H8E2J1_9RHOB|nr:PTS sugar transporter subunit IIA [Pseudorhodobacter antarcticus]SEN12988.1 PTS IIA-like nitrogen-regulatory protein PtsN [Pseudorhodobacter antarcticus]